MNKNFTLTPPIEMLIFDVADALTDRYIATMKMPYNPLLKLDLQEIVDFVYTKRPTLKYRKIIIEL